MATRSDNGMKERALDLAAKVVEIEAQLKNLTGKVEELTARQAADAPPPPATLRQRVVAADELELPEQLTPEMEAVVQLMQAGQFEEALTRLRALPPEALAAQPATVALVAAALFVQRGDYAAGLKSLDRALKLTSDPRLVRIAEQLRNKTP